MSGCSVRSSTIANTTSSASPPTMHAHVATESQPHWLACWRPSTLSPMPPTISTRPGTSIGAGCRSSTIFARATRNSATIATGTLIQKMARHVHSLR